MASPVNQPSSKKAKIRLPTATPATGTTILSYKDVTDPFKLIPDHLLRYNIVDKLDNITAGRTVAISKRWGLIWPCSRKVVLDDRCFKKSVGRRSAFLTFVRRFFERYQYQTMDSFTLRFSDPRELLNTEVRSWIVKAMTMNAKELDLYLTNAVLIPEVYANNKIETLRISGCLFDVMRLGDYANLRTLAIGRVTLTTTMLQRILNDCVHLEDLSLIQVRHLDEIRFNDRRNRLSRFSVERCEPLSYGITVEAPAVKYFKYTGSFVFFYLTFVNLEEVELDFMEEAEIEDYGAEADLLVQLLGQLGKASKMTVCSYVTQVIVSGDLRYGPPCTFDVLKELTIKASLHLADLPGVVQLLLMYPNLEKLFIEVGDLRLLKGLGYTVGRMLTAERFKDYQIVPFPQPISDLTTVKVQGLKGNLNELKLLEFLLRQSFVLREMEVKVEETMPNAAPDPRVQWFRQNLNLFTKVSAAVNLTVS